MANIITLSSEVPDVAPGETVDLVAKVVDSSSGTAVEGVTVKWAIVSADTIAKLGNLTSVTSVTGYALNTVGCDLKAAVTVTATLDDGTDTSATLEVGFYSTLLPAPVVPQATNGVLTEKETSGLIQALIMRHNDDPEQGDLYNFHWGKSGISRFDDGTSNTFPWISNIKNDFMPNEVLSDGKYTIYYTVKDLAQNVSYSVPTTITITGGTYINPIYDAPEFPEITNNTIGWNDTFDDILVKVPLPQLSDNAEIFSGNTITLYMKVFDRNYNTEIIVSKVVATYVVTQADIDSNKILLTLPVEMITDSKGTFDNVRGLFWYTVTGSGSVSVSGSSFTRRLIIDTVQPHKPRV